MKRFAALAMALMMLCGVAAAEGTGSEAVWGNPVYEGEWYAPVAGDTQIMTIGKSVRTSVSYLEGDTVEDNYLTRFMEKQLNVDYVYEWETDEGAYNERVNLMIAEGDLSELPDVFTVTASQLALLVEAEMVADLTDAYEAHVSPNLRGAIDDTNGLATMNCTFNGRLYAIPAVNCGENAASQLFIRDDWLKNLGLDAPTNIAELVEVALAFKNNDPDGNGEDDTVGLMCQSDITQIDSAFGSMNVFFHQNHAYPEYWYLGEDGKVAYGSVQPETREALQLIASLVEQGVIEKDFATTGWDQLMSAVKSGKCGMFFAPWWFYGQCVDMTVRNNACHWSSVLIKDADGVYHTAMLNPSDLYVVAKAGYTGLEALIKTCNLQWEMDQTQGLNLYQPAKGDSNVYNFMAMPLSLNFNRYNDKTLKAVYAREVYNGERDVATVYGEGLEVYHAYKEYMDNGASYEGMSDSGLYMMGFFVDGCMKFHDDAANIDWVKPASYTTTETMQMKWATLRTLEDQCFTQIILGEKDITAFDEFVEQWYKLGGTEILSEQQALVDAR